MNSWARPGVKCVCVDDTPRNGGVYTILPVKGGIYTIRSVVDWDWSHRSGKGVRLVELRRQSRLGDEAPWNIDRFRPLITQSDDVALFKHHLVTQEAEA